MICKACTEDYSKEFEVDFIDGVCLPCIVQYRHDLKEAKEAKELHRFNKKYSSDYDERGFNNLCWDGDIKIGNLKGFPALREIWENIQKDKDCIENSFDL